MMMNRKIILSGTNVALAAMTEADQPVFQQWLATNAELREQIDDPRIPSMEDQIRWFRRVQEPDRKFFSLVTVPDGVLIGNCGFVDIDVKKKEAILRITIGNANFLGKGLGSEAVSLLVRYGFEIMDLRRILLNVLSSNVRAIRSYQKTGFVTSKDLQGRNAMLTMSISNPAYS